MSASVPVAARSRRKFEIALNRIKNGSGDPHIVAGLFYGFVERSFANFQIRFLPIVDFHFSRLAKIRKTNS